jgi:signal transduction histidine kinase
LSEELLKSLVHDLRQPLSTIETSSYFLKLLIPEDCDRAHEQLTIIQQQVERAAFLLTQAVVELQQERARGGQPARAAMAVT